MSLVSSLEFLELLAEKKLNLELCSISSGLHMSKWNKLDTGTASPSKQFFSHIALAGLGKKILPIAIKLFPNDPNNLDIQGLIYEGKVYKKIIDTIIARNESPNFVAYVGTALCKNIPDFTGVRGRLETRSSFEGMSSKKGYYVLITEKAGNGSSFGFNGELKLKSLFRFVNKNIEDTMPQILFQIFYSLVVLQKYRIVHNDLHANNVLVAELPEEISLGFIIGGKSYLVKTKYIPYLFDWDLAYCESLGDNPKIGERREQSGTSNSFSEKRDLYTLICTMSDEKYIQTFYPTNVMSHKEQETEVSLTSDQLEYIDQFQPLFIDPDTRAKVYRFGTKQIKEIFGEDTFKDGFVSGNVAITPRGKAFLNNPHGCRMSTSSDSYPTAYDAMRLVGEQFETTEDLYSLTHFVYKPTRSSEAVKSKIDFFNTGQGRKEMEKMGVKPRFPFGKSGYIRTRNRE